MISDNDSVFNDKIILGIIIGLIFIAFDFDFISTFGFMLFLWLFSNITYD
mgnify:CR=1 FL=1